ncbi:glutamate--cysteine ligase [Geoalkalibacter ferrihydriticus]|uniref:Glutamate--cysteine ligase n=2 Tax=Geoalkalibacter ferrihydriticus TaxID=392333 RepID=A0A0C2DW63_9BACT|nr:glutamate-cysteine ligase family protein [Geoalkalibacter ferrihydriticus]KIH77669.1 gamma-glutamylcysteine synthetase [Geoalkalibacter ferrihydriticus DSM 17813]SDL72960.1 glutamate--cysteine ligase [Geoalkalibacter ferrihydriticus]
MTTLAKEGLDTPVSGTDALIAYLAASARPAERWGIGVESEKLVIDAQSGEAAEFARIEALLGRLEGRAGWLGIREEGRLIALHSATSSVTLEPGGQLELSGELCPDIHCCYGDFARHHEAVAAEAADLGLAFLGLGTQPFTPLENIGWVPKDRYRIMGPYMRRTGDLGQAMMKQSAGLQVNLDFSDEVDWIAKVRVGLLLAPVFYALFANSPLLAGRPSGFLSTRGEIWARTDPERTGLLPEIFQEDAGYASFVDYALDVPMYFIHRQGRYIALTAERLPFRRYLEKGWGEYRATLGDWDLHLSTIFTEVRLRPQIELRSADSLPPVYTLAVAALVKGLLYDAESLDASWRLLHAELYPHLSEVFPASWRVGLKAPVGRRSLGELCLDLLQLAREGLVRRRVANQRGWDETIYLDPIAELAAEGQTLAERLLARWQGSREQKVRILLDHCGFGMNPQPPQGRRSV